MSTAIMKKDHLKALKKIRNRHLKIHLVGILLLIGLSFLNWNDSMEIDIIKESYTIFKTQLNSMLFKQQLYTLLRNKALTINQAMDVADVILGQDRVPISIALAMIGVESDFDPMAVSKKGARGLTQIMPIVREAYANHSAFKQKIKQIHEVSLNVKLGLFYLGDLYDRFKDWKMALRAYNAGPENAHNKNFDGYANAVLIKSKEFSSIIQK